MNKIIACVCALLNGHISEVHSFISQSIEITFYTCVYVLLMGYTHDAEFDIGNTLIKHTPLSSALYICYSMNCYIPIMHHVSCACTVGTLLCSQYYIH